MSCSSRCTSQGFSLIEMAIALFIMALLLGGLLVPLRTQVESRRIEETRAILDQARDILLGFVTANGRFPCPAAGSATGVESFAAGGNATNGNCSTWFNGFLPATTLGFSPVDGSGYALDSWATGSTQNRIRYAVSNTTVNSITNPFTRNNGIRDAAMANVSSAQLLYVCNSGTGIGAADCGTAVTLGSNIIAVIYSLGQNAATGGTSTNESKNVDNNRVFVQAGTSAVAGAIFDDQLTWIGPPILFSRMIAAGTLP
ncbi:MAG: prepilin-type N-terminal cleavage/methylation domain-containing protein [Burkholderiales bacterium]